MRGLFGIIVGVMALAECVNAAELPKAGDWIEYKVMSASELTPTKIDYVTLTIGAPSRIEGIDAVWWQIVTKKTDGKSFTVQALSERAPMTTESGDIGIVFRYIFRQEGRPALEYVNEVTGRAHLPMFGFREALIPTPRSHMNIRGPFMGTGNYLGQPLAAHHNGIGAEWIDLELITRLVLNDDVLVGTARMFKDDGTGTDKDGEYKYVELTADDYNRMIDAGFNLFMVNDKHVEYVRERNVFFVKWSFGTEPYPEMLYRSNYWATEMFTDEPASLMKSSDCRSIHDVANLLKARNYAYHLAPGSAIDGVVKMIQGVGLSTGDWTPRQLHVPVWETIDESAFYQTQGGAAGMVHEGRYQLFQCNDLLGSILGPGAKTDVLGMFDLDYCFMRGAARCFGKEWGTAIYGQADYSIAPDAIRHAYDMGAHFVWFWTSDHEHHVTSTRQLELARVLRDHQKKHPRKSRLPQLRSARVAVAVPDGYLCGWGTPWGNAWFRTDKLDEYGVPYGDINSEAYWQMYRLLNEGTDFDCVIDVPEIINRAGYDKIIRIALDATTNQPNPAMPAMPLEISVKQLEEASKTHRPKAGALRTSAFYMSPGSMKIDGKLDEWSGAKWIDLKQQFWYEAEKQKWGGENDLSAQVAFAYNEDAIYIAARVKDDVMTSTERGEMIWLNDSLQVAFDPLFNPPLDDSYAMDDIEIGFSMVDGKPYAHRWEGRIAGAPGEIPGAEIAIVREGNMTFYEARVPLTSLAPLTPNFPGRCGMSAVVNDADNGSRKGAIGWTSGLTDGKYPARFGVLEFEGASKLKNAPPVVFAQPGKTVVKRGEKALFRLDAGAREAREIEVTATVRHGNLSVPASVTSFKTPAGMSLFHLELDTSKLASDSYKVDLTFESGGKTVVRQRLRFYVLP